MIPKRILRSVPADTTKEVESFWQTSIRLHPGWKHDTYREPIDPAQFPLTAPSWERCASGAQKAGLLRLESLWTEGGIWFDSDFEPYRAFDPLLGSRAFAAWEDLRTVPDAVLGSEPRHPAMLCCLNLAMQRLDQGAWESGPGVTTEVLVGRNDVLLLPPSSFYPYHFSERHRRFEDHQTVNPWAFGAHHWAASWLGETTEVRTDDHQSR
jgi:mannosyltransferase OCH1-like enzyme